MVFSCSKGDSIKVSIIMVVVFTKSCVLQRHKYYKIERNKGPVIATRSIIT